MEYFRENIQAVNVNISGKDDRNIRDIIESVGGRKGARYPESSMAQCFGDTPELDSE